MEFRRKGVVIQVEAAKQSNEWLLSSAAEIAKAAHSRELDLSAFCGGLVTKEATTEVITEVPAKSIKETLIDQFPTTFRGYKLTLESINQARETRNKVMPAYKEKLAHEFEVWFSEDKQAYIEAARLADPELRFTLVATPNMLLDSAQLIKAAKAFGEEQPNPTDVFVPLYESYSAEQLSGTKPNGGPVVIYSLIPTKTTNEFEGTVTEQLSKLEKLQSDHAFLKVPSPLEAISYWHTLRASGASLALDTAHDLTYISHFDLPIHQVEGELAPYVPQTFVGTDGGPVLSYSNAEFGQLARRIAVG